MGAQDIQFKLPRLGADISAVSSRALEDDTVGLSFFIAAQDADETPAGERIFDWAVANGLKILGMNRKKLSIEDIFVSLTAEEKTGGSANPGKQQKNQGGTQ